MHLDGVFPSLGQSGKNVALGVGVGLSVLGHGDDRPGVGIDDRVDAEALAVVGGQGRLDLGVDGDLGCSRSVEFQSHVERRGVVVDDDLVGVLVSGLVGLGDRVDAAERRLFPEGDIRLDVEAPSGLLVGGFDGLAVLEGEDVVVGHRCAGSVHGQDVVRHGIRGGLGCRVSVVVDGSGNVGGGVLPYDLIQEVPVEVVEHGAFAGGRLVAPVGSGPYLVVVVFGVSVLDSSDSFSNPQKQRLPSDSFFSISQSSRGYG